jgi:hypothetical protein
MKATIEERGARLCSIFMVVVHRARMAETVFD